MAETWPDDLLDSAVVGLEVTPSMAPGCKLPLWADRAARSGELYLLTRNGNYCLRMDVLQAALWGLAGSLCVEGLELGSRARLASRSKPRQVIADPAFFALALILRAGAGTALAGALAASDRMPDAITAFAYGIAAPAVMARLAGAVPLAAPASTTTQETSDHHSPEHKVSADPSSDIQTTRSGSSEAGSDRDAG